MASHDDDTMPEETQGYKLSQPKQSLAEYQNMGVYTYISLFPFWLFDIYIIVAWFIANLLDRRREAMSAEKKQVGGARACSTSQVSSMAMSSENGLSLYQILHTRCSNQVPLGGISRYGRPCLGVFLPFG